MTRDRGRLEIPCVAGDNHGGMTVQSREMLDTIRQVPEIRH